MALSSRAHAFSVAALVGRPSKRKLQEGGEEEEERKSAAGKSEQPGGKYSHCPEPVARAYWIRISPPGSRPDLAISHVRGRRDTSTTWWCRSFSASESLREYSRFFAVKAEKQPETEPSTTASSACGTDSGVGNSPESLEEKDIQMELQGAELWKKFHDIGTEMIITKVGRRMFPSVRVKVKGLDPGKQYYMAIDVVPVDSKRYKYVYHSSRWIAAGNTDHLFITPRFYVHPNSPCSGETWMQQIICFDRMKLTNNEMDDKGHIILQSMHKYKPRVHVMEQDSSVDLSQIQSLPTERVKTFSFKETEFTTVTAYQNQQITKLKIDRNPFAKGFRDPGRNRGVLDGLLDTYPWRPSFTLNYKTFGADTQSKKTWNIPVAHLQWPLVEGPPLI
ncbi:T-box transcription factor TBX22 [Plecturocebus cupreus]